MADVHLASPGATPVAIALEIAGVGASALPILDGAAMGALPAPVVSVAAGSPSASLPVAAGAAAAPIVHGDQAVGPNIVEKDGADDGLARVDCAGASSGGYAQAECSERPTGGDCSQAHPPGSAARRFPLLVWQI